MWQTIIVICIVALAAYYFIRQNWKKIRSSREEGCDSSCGCGGCDHRAGCPLSQPDVLRPDQVDTERRKE